MSSEESIERNPNLHIANLKFLLSLPEHENDENLKSELLELIHENHMAPFYESTCRDLKWTINESFLATLKEMNEEHLEELDRNIEDAECHMGRLEVKEALLHKASYLCRIGDKERSVAVLKEAFAQTVASGYQIDNVLQRIRIGLFFNDHSLMKSNIDLAGELIARTNDWDRKNRLKVYQGVYSMAFRDFETATSNFLECVSIFNCGELFDYSKFIEYVVYCCMLVLTRPELREKVLKGSDLLQALHENEELKEYLFSLYECRYAHFFVALAKVETSLREDIFLHPHYKYYVKEMKIRAYNQLLASYKALSLENMAHQFGVSPEFMENELSRYIAAGRINCKIDKVTGLVNVTLSDAKVEQFKDVIKKGDVVLNRVQKLTRILDM